MPVKCTVSDYNFGMIPVNTLRHKPSHPYLADIGWKAMLVTKKAIIVQLCQHTCTIVSSIRLKYSTTSKCYCLQRLHLHHLTGSDWVSAEAVGHRHSFDKLGLSPETIAVREARNLCCSLMTCV